MFRSRRVLSNEYLLAKFGFALYHSCSTAFSVLEESGQVYLSCARIPGALLFSFLREGPLDLACLLACFDAAENEPCKVCPLSAYRSPRCYYDVKWVCGDDGDVVCVAKQGKKEPRLVGDLLCSSRGTPKPEKSDMESCEKAVSIGTVPDESCLLSSTPTPGAEHGPLLFGSGAIFVRLLLGLFVTD